MINVNNIGSWEEFIKSVRVMSIFDNFPLSFALNDTVTKIKVYM